MTLTIIVYVLYLIGLAASGGFLVMHRPKTLRKETILAMGFPVSVFLVLLRGVASLIGSRTVAYHGPLSTVVSLGIFVLVDAIMVFLFVSFVDFRRKTKYS